MKPEPTFTPEQPDTLSALLGKHRSCYFIPPQSGDDGFVPALVIEGKLGYHMLSGNGPYARPWIWGKTEHEANEVCNSVNLNRGISKACQLEIILSTMPGNFPKHIARATKGKP